MVDGLSARTKSLTGCMLARIASYLIKIPTTPPLRPSGFARRRALGELPVDRVGQPFLHRCNPVD